MNRIIFKTVANSFSFIGHKTGLTHNEINIIVYYFGISFSCLCLLDIIFNFHYFKIAFVIFTLSLVIGCINFKTYPDWLFDKSASFLNYFNSYGSNYVASSVLICVSLLIAIYAFLISLILIICYV